ncbi:PRC and DUF2382 domain-containing protein [Corynebacterium heidelbergense]|uniref:Photosystem reaction center subunit H n=1 Tax=Corynebacterium heidelbergense TaxID=2055947 RepID=A0A364VD35_9CORY|nr:PRC and DUF2382 domain-containing protein [Corynebacterium heidelbergense]RAV34572.1 photosystem reaction center subunit H [Corynebacterium heidelbergense]WCZ36336.1 Stress response protein YsnF [Corynebacterium heidelbergense]
MTNEKQIHDLFDATAYDREGDKLGSVKEVFLDERTGQPTFVEVGHGLFGMSSSLVPLRGHRLNGDNLQLAFAKDRIADAPSLDVDNGLTPEEQNRVYEHYGVHGSEDTERYATDNRGETNTHREEAATTATTGVGTHTEQRHVADRDHAATNNDGEIIRSEERMNVSKENVATGRARLRKYVVTDKETVEVPVTREEVRVERTPISADEAANYKGHIGEESAEVTLHEERVNVSKESVPVEKVNLSKEQITDTERHSEELRKEQIDTDGVTDLKHDDRR